MSSTRRETQGFTLIKLLVVIAVTGMITAVVLTALGTARVRARLVTAGQSLHAMQAAARSCIKSSAAPLIPTETGDGGSTQLCTGAGAYVVLPAGWLYCDERTGTQGAGDCGDDLSGPSTMSSFRIVAESDADGYKITCSEIACTTVADTD